MDVDNLYFSVKAKYNGRKLHFEKYVQAMPADYKVAYCRQYPKDSPQFFKRLLNLKFEVNFGCFYCYVPMALKASDLLSKFDTLVIGSTSECVVDLMEWAKKHGKQVKCFACQIPKSFASAADCFEIGEELLDEPSTLT